MSEPGAGSAGLSRRRLLGAAIGLPLVSSLSGCQKKPLPRSADAAPAEGRLSQSSSRLAAVERDIGGRLGVAALHTASGARVELRPNERFALCSTFKLVLAAATLERADSGKEQLTRRIVFDESALLEYAPVTRAQLAQSREGMSVEALCEASVTLSDNTAANLLLEALGGPAAMTAYFRALGDSVSRLDRNEPMLNTAIPGDERDTTTPAAMLATLHTLLLGDTLSQASRIRCIDWLVAAETGRNRLRAGLPSSFRVGDKTGSGLNGATCDVAIAWPPDQAPLLIAAYAMGSSASIDALNAAFARVARIVIDEFGLG